ncbi:MAG: amidohydrolase [Candidatus Rokubacteria bacterium]|nr:amidohydrolase [Candidatus Rokubacteria bacterium]MBI3108950.1 amidohydrolase [Candidatus Rokubacteria bacterium]
MTTPRTVDAHAHFVPPRVLEELARHPDRYGAGVEELEGGRKRVRFPDLGSTRPVLPRLLDLAARRHTMTATGVDQEILAPWMDLVGYSLPPEEGQRWSRLLNESLAEALHADGSGSFLGVATVPLQDGTRAAAELEHAIGGLGLRAVQIGTNVMGSPLDRPGLDPFWAAAAALRVPIILHPWHVAGEDRLGPHGFLRLLGYPFDTTLAAGAMVFGGVADRFPELRVMLVHAGGFFPYQAGRLERGHRLEAGARGLGPIDALRWFYYDTITHWALPLRYLAEVTGADRIMLGSDYPFDVGDPDPVASVRAARLTESAEVAILGATALTLFGGTPPAGP